MTKMNGINLPDMIGDQTLMVEDIFNENFTTKRKKLEDYSDEMKKTADGNEFPDNNNVKIIDKRNLKRKVKNVIVDDNYINTELNISIDKDSNRTIRLELRHPGNDNSHENEEEQVSLDSGQIEEYGLKNGVDLNMDGNEKNGEASGHDGEYADGNCSDGNDVSFFFLSHFFYWPCLCLYTEFKVKKKPTIEPTL